MDSFHRMNRQGVFDSVADVIGNTPLVDLARLTKNHEGRILAKLEYLNPGFSKKDRIALQIIDDAEEKGRLSPGQTVVELTSGNTGTGLAIVCALRGYPFVAVMSKGNSIERVRMMEAFGAEVLLVDQAPNSVSGQVSGADLELVETRARNVTMERRAFRADQFFNTSGLSAHYLHTGAEIVRQSKGMVTAFCDFVGTGGTFAGCAKALREHNSSIQCFVVEPTGASVLNGDPVTRSMHRIQGGGYLMAELPLLGNTVIDGFLQVSDEAAMTMASRLAQEEGIFGGFSAGANAAAALQLLEGPCRGGTVVILICDSGLKYLSTDLWEQNCTVSCQ